jgi:hypothetical protein
MALTTYAELQTAVASWLARSDLTATIPDFITLAEAHFNRVLRVRPMEDTETLTPVSGSATLPTDFLAYRRVTWAGDTARELEYMHPSILSATYPDSAEGTPSNFTIEGSTLKVRPSSDEDVTLQYFQKIPALSGTVNWLFSSHPDAYLFGALAEARGFVMDPEQMSMWMQRRDQALEEVRAVDFAYRGGMSVRAMSATP